jgi:hypothetical protein
MIIKKDDLKVNIEFEICFLAVVLKKAISVIKIRTTSTLVPLLTLFIESSLNPKLCS